MDDLQWRAAQAQWEDPANWRLFGSCYYAPRDPRVWVRKREPRFGWTTNFAHPAAWFWVAAIVGVPVTLTILRIAAR